ncbi:MAG: ABC transporter permease [Lachnospiraceae bacterium]|nr:ABC transporter permease [Lachnospiraceae bacterium]
MTGKKRIGITDIFQKYAIIIAWVILFVIFSIWMPGTFNSLLNIRTLLGSQSVLVIAALAVLIPIISGDYDMSVTATLTVVNIAVAKLNVSAGLPIGACILIGLAIGAVIGAANGFIITRFKLNAFIVTMGMYTFLSGIALLVSLQTVTGVDQVLKNAIYVNKIYGISPSFFYALILTAVIAYILSMTMPGKRILIVGRGENVARLSGINVEKTRFLCFVFSGLIAAFGGIVYTGVLGGGSPTGGLSYMMPAFAAVFLGSTCFRPGRFNAPGTIIAVYFLSTGTNGLQLHGAQSYVTDLFYGIALIVAVVFSAVAQKSQENKEVKAAKKRNETAAKLGGMLQNDAAPQKMAVNLSEADPQVKA